MIGAREAAAADARRPLTQPGAAASRERRAVYVAEDDPWMRNLLAHAARRAGFPAILCGHGGELMARLREHGRIYPSPPALIVSDERMPVLTGLGVLSTIRGWGWRSPFVLITAFPDDEVLERARALEASRVLCKPFALAELFAAVRPLLAEGAVEARCAGCAAPALGAPGAAYCPECEPTSPHRVVPADDALLDLGGSD